jgi:hypothetical protein
MARDGVSGAYDEVKGDAARGRVYEAEEHLAAKRRSAAALILGGVADATTTHTRCTPSNVARLAASRRRGDGGGIGKKGEEVKWEVRWEGER